MRRICLSAMGLLAVCLLSGCAGVYGMVYKDAATVLAYPDQEVIRNQAEVATFAVSSQNGLYLDGVQVMDDDRNLNPDLRLSQNTGMTSIYTVDVMPGRHHLAMTINQSSLKFDGNTHIHEYVRTETPAELVYDFQPGGIYYVELRVSGRSGWISIEPMPESIREMIIENRLKAQF